MNLQPFSALTLTMEFPVAIISLKNNRSQTGMTMYINNYINKYLILYHILDIDT